MSVVSGFGFPSCTATGRVPAAATVFLLGRSAVFIHPWSLHQSSIRSATVLRPGLCTSTDHIPTAQAQDVDGKQTKIMAWTRCASQLLVAAMLACSFHSGTGSNACTADAGAAHFIATFLYVCVLVCCTAHAVVHMCRLVSFLETCHRRACAYLAAAQGLLHY